MGKECLQILLNLNLPEEDKRKLDKCLEALESYFKPCRNLVYERYVFYTCVQQSEESVQSYITRLRKLAASCEYGALTDKLIRGRLVIGLKNQGEILEGKIPGLEESHTDVQYEWNRLAENQDDSRCRRQQDRRRKEIHREEISL